MLYKVRGDGAVDHGFRVKEAERVWSGCGEDEADKRRGPPGFIQILNVRGLAHGVRPGHSTNYELIV